MVTEHGKFSGTADKDDDAGPVSGGFNLLMSSFTLLCLLCPRTDGQQSLGEERSARRLQVLITEDAAQTVAAQEDNNVRDGVDNSMEAAPVARPMQKGQCSGKRGRRMKTRDWTTGARKDPHVALRSWPPQRIRIKSRPKSFPGDGRPVDFHLLCETFN